MVRLRPDVVAALQWNWTDKKQEKADEILTIADKLIASDKIWSILSIDELAHRELIQPHVGKYSQ